jgi:hypothetical protein
MGLNDYEVWHDDVELKFDDEDVRPEWRNINVFGCGLVLLPENKYKLWIFFTVNGTVVGELAL